jgi:hypothetical protein
MRVRDVRTVDVQLSDSDSSTRNKSGKSPHEQKSTQKEVL